MEALKDNTDGKLILAQARALEHMQKAGIVPKHQILDNQKSAAYEEAIRASGMTFEHVPPDDHHRNMAEKAIVGQNRNPGVLQRSDARKPRGIPQQSLGVARLRTSTGQVGVTKKRGGRE